MNVNLHLVDKQQRLNRSIDVDHQPTDSKTNQLTEHLSSVAMSRDKQAFAILFSFFAPSIKRIAINKLNTQAAAMDVVQQTMTQVWQKAHLFNPDKGEATTWVYTMMRNVIFDVLRKRKNVQVLSLSDDIWPDEQQAPEDTFTFVDHLETRQLNRLVEQLPEAQKQVVEAIYFKHLSQQQLAQQLDVPLGTVKSRLRLALARLKQQLGTDND